MIIFKQISYKNFMSVGNAPVVVKLNEHPMTLLLGTNGNGKSTIMDALCYALYGKAYRNINKDQLVNSINHKGALVVVDFSVGQKQYSIKRGIKPHIFEIYENGKIINQNPSIRDYQNILEQQILKMNYRAFTQVVIMGSGSYVPFMKLKSNERREFIEDLLDIRLFSVMNTLLKDKLKDTKDSLKDIEAEMRRAREKAELQQSFIEKRKKEKGESIQKVEEEIVRLQADIDSWQLMIDEFSSTVEQLTERAAQYENMAEALSELTMEKKKLQSTSEQHKKDHDFYHNIETCPTCKQGIEEHHRDSIIQGVQGKISEVEKLMQDIQAKMAKVSSDLALFEELNSQISDKNQEISKYNKSITVNNALIRKARETITAQQNDTVSIDEETEKLRELARGVLATDKQKRKLLEEQQYMDTASVLLQDNGIKAKIIKQYVPVINKLVNKYLNALDFYVSFNLDENFNELIKSRHRDAFTYESFSEGERLRIDLALTFAWRDIARMKNSVNTNLLMMDEIADGSIDAVGMDLMVQLMYGFKDTNAFIVSHRDGVQDKFTSVVKFIKKNNFTILE